MPAKKEMLHSHSHHGITRDVPIIGSKEHMPPLALCKKLTTASNRTDVRKDEFYAQRDEIDWYFLIRAA